MTPTMAAPAARVVPTPSPMAARLIDTASALLLSALLLAAWRVAIGFSPSADVTPAALVWMWVMGALLIEPWIEGLQHGLDILEPKYISYGLFLLLFWARPLQLLTDPGSPGIAMPREPWLFERGLFVSTMAVFGFGLGYRWRMAERMAALYPLLGSKWDARRLRRMTLVYVSIGVMAFAAAVQLVGGWQTIIGNLQGRRLFSSSGAWVVGSWKTLVDVAAALVITSSLCGRTSSRWGWLLAAVALLLTLPLGGRADILVLVWTVCAIVYYTRVHRRVRARTLLLVLAVLVLTSAVFVVGYRAIRVATAQGRDPLDPRLMAEAFAEFPSEFMADFEQFDWLVFVLDNVPEILPYQRGGTFLDFFVQFVPRALWPDKPLPISFQLSVLAGGPASGTPASLAGELYINWGVAGVLVGMITFGAFVRSAYVYLLAHLDSPAAIVLYSYTLASLHSLITRSLAQKLFGYVLFVGPLLLAWAYVTAARREEAAEALP